MGFLTSVWCTGGPPTVHFAPKPTLLPVRKADGSEEAEYISIKTLLETRCGGLFAEYKPNWWLFNGHLQTIYSVLGDFSKYDHMSYRRTYLRLADGGTLGLDFAPTDQSSLPHDTPIVVVQHGLTGGSYEAYVRAVLSRACAPRNRGGLGYRAVVVNFRGCAGVPITSPLFYSAGQTDDTRHALMHIAHLYPNAPLLGLGFSLGANVLTRYLGEEGSQSRISSACVLSCPWDLKQNSNGLSNSFVGRHIYSKGMGGNLLRILKRNLGAFAQDPEHQISKAACATVALKNPTLKAFDETFTRISGGPAPHFPFRDADEYYTWGSSHHMLKDITVPFLAMNSIDDPIVQYIPMDGAGNGRVVMGLTQGGGHLGWFQEGPGYVDRWTTKPVLQWLKLVGEGLIHDKVPRAYPVFVDQEGYLREEGRERLGCKVSPGGGIIDGNGGEAGILRRL